jgi:hypothetical protein
MPSPSLRPGSRISTSALGALGVATLAVSAACSFVFDAERAQCKASSECRSPPGDLLRCEQGLCVSTSKLPLGSKYDCRGSIPYTYPETLTLEISDFNQTGPASESKKPQPLSLDVRVCRDDDPGCAAPVDGPHPTDASGRVTVRLPGPGLRLETVATNADEGLFPPSNFAPADALRGIARLRPDKLVPVQIAKRAINDLLAQFGNATVDPASAQLVVTVLPCASSDALGLGYTVDRALPGTRYYVGSGVPDFTSETTLRGAIYPLSIGGFVNVPAGRTDIQLRDPTIDALVFRFAVDLRPGTVTYALADVAGRAP